MNAREVIAMSLRRCSDLVWVSDIDYGMGDAVIAALREHPEAVLGLLSPEVRADIRRCVESWQQHHGPLKAAERLLDLLARSEP